MALLHNPVSIAHHEYNVEDEDGEAGARIDQSCSLPNSFQRQFHGFVSSTGKIWKAKAIDFGSRPNDTLISPPPPPPLGS